MKVVTLTLNPAFDVHATAQSFSLYAETIADIAETDSGGKGINLSRALTMNHVENTAVVIVGSENGDSFLRGLEPFHLTLAPIFVPGRIRENITVHPVNDKETRLSFSGFSVRPEVINDVKKAIGDVDENTIITLTGSNAKGFRLEDVKALVKELAARGAKVVIDSRSFSLADLKELKPWLIKPNAPELAAYFRDENMTLSQIKEAAASLHEAGIENVMVTLGGDGALFVSGEGAYKVTLPHVTVKSTIGAGDSTIAGFIAGYLQGYNAPDCLKSAVSFGSAKCMREGTLPPLPEDVKALFESVTVEPV